MFSLPITKHWQYLLEDPEHSQSQYSGIMISDTSNNQIICRQSTNIIWVSKCRMEYPLTNFFKIINNEGNKFALPIIPWTKE